MVTLENGKEKLELIQTRKFDGYKIAAKYLETVWIISSFQKKSHIHEWLVSFMSAEKG